MKDAYFGGASGHQRPLLNYLADHRGQWISSTQLATALQIKPKSLRGVLGAFTKLVGATTKLFESRPGDDSTVVYLMLPEVAEAIDQLRVSHAAP